MTPPVIISEAQIYIAADTLTKPIVKVTNDLAREACQIGRLDTDPMFLSKQFTGSARLRPQ